MLRFRFSFFFQGCRVCGQNVIHLDGECNALIPTGIRDSSPRPQANIAQETRGSHSVLFEDNDWRGEAFHIPIIIDESIFEGSDDIVAPVNTTATILGEPAIAVAAPVAIEATTGEEAMEEAVAEASAMSIRWALQHLMSRYLRTNQRWHMPQLWSNLK